MVIHYGKLVGRSFYLIYGKNLHIKHLATHSNCKVQS